MDEQLLKAIKNHLLKTFGVKVHLKKWTGSTQLPLFLSGGYRFYQMYFFDRSCLLITPKIAPAAPAIVEKHMRLLQKHFSGYCIYVEATTTPSHRSWYIRHRIPFIIPSNQIFLPDLGIDLRERYRKPKSSLELLSPSTQAIIIFALQKPSCCAITTTNLVQALKYSRMTVNRAFDEIKASSLGPFTLRSRERCWLVPERKQLWDLAKQKLCSPVKKRIWVKGSIESPKAGLTALAEYSLLSAPDIPIYASSYQAWIKSKQKGLQAVTLAEDADAELEIWRYDPELLTETNFVDPFSLYLSLNEIEDERVNLENEQMIENLYPS